MMIGDMMRLFIRNIYKHNHLYNKTMNSIFKNGKWEVGEVTFEVILRVFVDIGQKCRGRPKIAQQSFM